MKITCVWRPQSTQKTEKNELHNNEYAGKTRSGKAFEIGPGPSHCFALY